MPTTLHIHGGRVIDPAQQLDANLDVVIQDDRIAAVGPSDSDTVRQALATAGEVQTIDAAGLIVTPGLIDMNVHLPDSGREDSETIYSAVRAAAAGGFTAIVVMPDTAPPVDTEAQAEYLFLQAQRAAGVHVFPAGALTVARAGEALTEMGLLSRAGVVAFSDDHVTLADTGLLRKALTYAAMHGKPVIDHAEDPSLAKGVAHAGEVSARLGLTASQAAAEEIAVARGTILARDTGAHVHFAHLTTQGAVAEIARAKAAGINITAAVTPHHLLLTDERLTTFNANAYKVSPPLRDDKHRLALLAGLVDGTIDCIASDHVPVASEEKWTEWDRAPAGVIGLETTVAVLFDALVQPGHLSWSRFVEALATRPAAILGLRGKGDLRVGTDADLTLFDPNRAWTVDPKALLSHSRNTPFAGQALTGKAHSVIVAGRHLAD